MEVFLHELDVNSFLNYKLNQHDQKLHLNKMNLEIKILITGQYHTFADFYLIYSHTQMIVCMCMFRDLS